jgi:AhpD family alkylhydroperoxidase
MLTETILDRISKTIRHVKPVQFGAALGLTAQVYQQMQADFMPAPLITLHSSRPGVMAGVWSILRETLLAGLVDRGAKEVVAAAVSKANECPYCVDAHTIMLQAGSHAPTANAILRGDYTSIENPQFQALAQWASRLTPSDDAPPFSAEDAPEFLGVALTFHYINRMVNIFLGDTVLPIPTPIKGITRRVYAATEGKRIVRPRPAGDSLKLLPKAPLPDDFAWASGNPAVADAFAGFINMVEQAGRAVLPEAVRALVTEYLQVWQGEPMGIGRRWLEEAVNTIEAKHRPAARLALLTALASYQVDDNTVNEFRAQYPEDMQLIGATAWASMVAMRRIGTWMSVPFMNTEVKLG